MPSQTDLIDDRVQHLIEQYRFVQELHPLVAAQCADPAFECVLTDLLRHEHFVIKSRSQVLPDGEVTIAQLAFTALYEIDEDYMAAIALWVEEIVGTRFVPLEKKPKVLMATVKAREMIVDRTVPSRRSRSHSEVELTRRAHQALWSIRPIANPSCSPLKRLGCGIQRFRSPHKR